MYYVYLLQSEHYDERYVGFTNDLKARLEDHNAGKSAHTKKFKPWKLKNYISFTDEGMARNFERYLKTGSGRAFMNRHFF